MTEAIDTQCDGCMFTCAAWYALTQSLQVWSCPEMAVHRRCTTDLSSNLRLRSWITAMTSMSIAQNAQVNKRRLEAIHVESET